MLVYFVFVFLVFGESLTPEARSIKNDNNELSGGQIQPIAKRYQENYNETQLHADSLITSIAIKNITEESKQNHVADRIEAENENANNTTIQPTPGHESPEKISMKDAVMQSTNHNSTEEVKENRVTLQEDSEVNISKTMIQPKSGHQNGINVTIKNAEIQQNRIHAIEINNKTEAEDETTNKTKINSTIGHKLEVEIPVEDAGIQQNRIKVIPINKTHEAKEYHPADRVDSRNETTNNTKQNLSTTIRSTPGHKLEELITVEDADVQKNRINAITITNKITKAKEIHVTDREDAKDEITNKTKEQSTSGLQSDVKITVEDAKIQKNESLLLPTSVRNSKNKVLTENQAVIIKRQENELQKNPVVKQDQPISAPCETSHGSNHTQPNLTKEEDELTVHTNYKINTKLDKAGIQKTKQPPVNSVIPPEKVDLSKKPDMNSETDETEAKITDQSLPIAVVIKVEEFPVPILELKQFQKQNNTKEPETIEEVAIVEEVSTAKDINQNKTKDVEKVTDQPKVQHTNQIKPALGSVLDNIEFNNMVHQVQQMLNNLITGVESQIIDQNDDSNTRKMSQPVTFESILDNMEFGKIHQIQKMLNHLMIGTLPQIGALPQSQIKSSIEEEFGKTQQAILKQMQPMFEVLNMTQQELFTNPQNDFPVVSIQGEFTQPALRQHLKDFQTDEISTDERQKQKTYMSQNNIFNHKEINEAQAQLMLELLQPSIEALDEIQKKPKEMIISQVPSSIRSLFGPKSLMKNLNGVKGSITDEIPKNAKDIDIISQIPSIQSIFRTQKSLMDDFKDIEESITDGRTDEKYKPKEKKIIDQIPLIQNMFGFPPSLMEDLKGIEESITDDHLDKRVVKRDISRKMNQNNKYDDKEIDESKRQKMSEILQLEETSETRNIQEKPDQNFPGTLQTSSISHVIRKRDLLDLIIQGIEMYPGVPKLPYRKMLNPLGIKMGVDLKGGVKLNHGNVEVTGVLGAHSGALGMVGGAAVGAKGSLGLQGASLSVGGAAGYGSTHGENGAVAMGDTEELFATHVDS